MKKNKVINALLVGCAMFAITGGVVGVQNQTTGSANNTQTQLVEPETFASIQGAQVRKTVDSAGIRFSTLVNDTWLDTDLAGKTVEYGYIVAKDFNGTELTEANGTKVKAEKLLSVDTNSDGETDFYRYNFAITDIPTTDYEVKVSARAYVTIDGQTTYGEMQTRSIAEVAAKAFAVGEEDPDNVISGYVNTVAQGVSFEEATQKLNKAVITAETAGLAVTTQPAGYAVKLTSSNEEVAKIVNGKIVPQAKEGKATITASFGTNQTTTYDLTVVSYSATLGGAAIADDSLVKVNVADGYFASITNGFMSYDGTTATYGASVATQASEATEKLIVKEYDGTDYTDVTASAEYAYSVENVATVDSGTITGGTVNGKTSVSAKIDGYEVANFDVEGWTEITTIAQMQELSLVTWRERNNENTVKAVLGGNYILGNDLSYNGAYLLPIANTDIFGDEYVYHTSQTSRRQSYDSWLWEDVLKPITSTDDWTALNFNRANNTGSASAFKGSNPLNLPFTGTLDGNGYSIKNAQLLHVNFLATDQNKSTAVNDTVWYAAGACFIGTNEGTLRNVSFEDLRYHKSTNEGEITTEGRDGYQIYAISTSATGTLRNYTESSTKAILGSFVRNNVGTISDVKVSYYGGDYAAAPSYMTKKSTVTEGVLVKRSLSPTYGIHYNTGTVKNFVLQLAELPEGQTTIENLSGVTNGEITIKDGSYGQTYIMWVHNDGVMQDCLFLADAATGEKSLYIHRDSDIICNPDRCGTVCKSEPHDAPVTCYSVFDGKVWNANKVAYNTDWLADTTNWTVGYDTTLWDLETMTLKKTA